jgi:TPR repeat protein
MYDKGLGVAQDSKLAVEWYRKAAEQGNDAGQTNLGTAYGQGIGVPQDFREAAKWLLKAAEQGDTLAQIKLGLAYSEGRGVPQDYVEAHKWVNLAVASSNGEEAISYTKQRDHIAESMTSQQIADAQQLAREWQPKKRK